jgi:hypothetical protein
MVLLRPRGLRRTTTYRVRFQDAHRTFAATGVSLMKNGIVVYLPKPETAEIVYIDPK